MPNQVLDKIAEFLFRHKVHPNAVSFAGLGVSALSCALLVTGRFFTAAIFILMAGCCDLLDGKLARLKAQPGKFGALLDSSLDRLSDAFYFGGLLFYFIFASEFMFAALAFSALVAAFEISYVRARSEGLGCSCSVGFWEREERIAVLILGLVFYNPWTAILILGSLPHVTAFRRLFYSKQRLEKGALPEGASDIPAKDRRKKAYLIPLGLIILALLLVRL